MKTFAIVQKGTFNLWSITLHNTKEEAVKEMEQMKASVELDVVVLWVDMKQNRPTD